MELSITIVIEMTTRRRMGKLYTRGAATLDITALRSENSSQRGRLR